ncbi:DNA replication licensing factor mcm10 [Echria macrotheca]|uniref:DNA replication licensing factor mcm10 n=1 Tax=Echria macrotheca TaxID=438768 RepID=A0AAJ0BK10_9PEZI|nr:DNA replication licensing factor mcm10 [Echria macrotheca]
MASNWPPRSPHEALLGTPSGRERLRRLAERGSPTPSPSRLRTSRSVSAFRTKNGLAEAEDDEDEDEEMLQLKLQAIEAKLKLKKLAVAKAKNKAASGSEEGGTLRPDSAPPERGLRELPIQSKIAAARDRMERIERSAPPTAVEVPASPVRKAQNRPDVQTSPQRVILGIDKGLRAADVSLKRAPSLRKVQEERSAQQGGYLRRSKTPLPGQAQQAEARPMTFNERLASARSEEASRQERQARIQKARSTAFSVGKQEMEEYKTKAVDIPEQPYKPREYTRTDILSSTGGASGGQLPRSATATGVRTAAAVQDESRNDESVDSSGGNSEASFESYSGLHLSKRILPHGVLTRAITGKKTYLIKDLLRHVKAPDWSLPDVESDIVVFAIIASKSDPRSHRPGPGNEGKAQKDRGKYMVVTLVDLQYEVELFLFNTGFDRFWKLTPGTVLAILNPTIMPPPPGREATGRFGLVINSDADTILEVGSARDLGYCKSVKKDGQLCSSWINMRRTEYCEFHTNEAIRKSRENRIELNTTSAFGSGGGGKGPRSKKYVRHGGGGAEADQAEAADGRRGGNNYDRGAHSHFFVSGAHRELMDDEREGGLADRAEREEALKRKLQRQERERDIAKRLAEMGGGAGKEYMGQRAAAVRASSSVGALRSSVSSSSTTTSAAVSGSLSSRVTNTSLSSTAASTAGGGGGGTGVGDMHHPHRWDARALGLVGRRGDDGPKVSLGPVKRKRPESSASSSTVGGSQSKATAFGWGSSLKDKLARMKEGERLDGVSSKEFESSRKAEILPPPPAAAISGGGGGGGTGGKGGEKGGSGSGRSERSPVRKKTRFVTDKGIREAGRESLGEPLSAAAKSRRQVVLDDDDDDDLIIVK